jgi:GTP cyclohydrolase I
VEKEQRNLRDIQSGPDYRGIDIQKVGVKGVQLPFLLRMKDGSYQQIQTRLQLAVDLPREYKGTHMSRFVEVLNEWRHKPVSGHEIREILEDARTRLNSVESHLEMDFKCFLPKNSPITDLPAVMDYDCCFSGSLSDAGYRFNMTVNVPFTSLCPCSKAISSYGAHNQRAVMRVKVSCLTGRFIWIEDLVRTLEEQASCPVYPLLKREDEKYVTEKAYENPKFVEDVLRDVIVALRAIPVISNFEVECESFESIHNHSAYAYHLEKQANRLGGDKE